ncbi:MAG: S41 family peptidase [Chthoniobacterales bacterium]
MKTPVALLGLLVCAVSAVAQDAAVPVVTPAARLELLDAEQLQKAIDALRQGHVRGASVDETALTRATLRGLLEGLAPGAELTGELTAPAAESPFRSEVLDDRAGYIRLGALQSENVAQLDAALREFTEQKVQGVVLDLRATPESADFIVAAQVAERFCAPGTALFSLVAPAPAAARDFVSSSAPLYRGVLVVLIDEDTSGAAEALAAALRWNAKALLVGTRSSGRCVEFTMLPLGGGQNLRLASAEVRVAGQSVYPRGLRPDIEVPQDAEVREIILAEALETGMAPFVFERERAQFNEAALVAGTNPEIDREPSPSGFVDRPLQRAVDLVTAVRLFRKPD